MPLAQVENYVNINKHLPNIPSAKDVEANGINLSEMQIKQMEKIEELFLHLIELKKENEVLKKRVESLEKKSKSGVAGIPKAKKKSKHHKHKPHHSTNISYQKLK